MSKNNKSTAWYARKYTEKYNLALVPIEPGRKFPRSADWGHNVITDPSDAEKFYTENPAWNVGMALGPSGIGSLDVDCLASFAVILSEFGINESEILKYPTIQGRDKGYRVTFKIPGGVSLPYIKLNWPARNDPAGDKHKAAMAAAAEARNSGDTEREARIRKVAKRWARYTVFELRSACDGSQKQDVLPPSIHPDTGKPYRWITQPPADGVWLEPPAWLLAIWQNWGRFKPQIQGMCPWIPAEIPEPKKTGSIAAAAPGGGQDVIGEFNRSNDLEIMLSAYGYQKKSSRRYLSPHSSTGLPGVILFKDRDSCYIHHSSDPLCSVDSGKPVSPFDLYLYYEHGGDIKKAVKSAAEMLGIKREEPTRPVEHKQTSSHIDAGDDHIRDDQPSRDYMSPLPWTSDKGTPLKHIDNLREICRRLGVILRYNVIKKDEEILIPGESFTMDNQSSASLAWLASECSIFRFSTDKLGEFITYLADQNLYNPVAQWIDSRPWDGVNRLSDFLGTVRAVGESSSVEKKSLKETLITRWMISAVAGAYSANGISAAGVLTFQGPQYIGKTKWFKSLVPSDLDLVKDGMLLRPDDKDSVKQVCSFWLVELGELDATFRKSDISALKSFINLDRDILRQAYAKKESKYARRTVFFASVNPQEFLHDETGNRRYWTIQCESIDHSHSLDMQQIWAEIKAMWLSGEGYYLTASEMDLLNSHNEDFMARDPVHERLLSGLDWDSPQEFWRWAQATEVAIECGIDRPSRADISACAKLLRMRNGNQSKRSNGKTKFLCPPLN